MKPAFNLNRWLLYKAEVQLVECRRKKTIRRVVTRVNAVIEKHCNDNEPPRKKAGQS